MVVSSLNFFIYINCNDVVLFSLLFCFLVVLRVSLKENTCFGSLLYDFRSGGHVGNYKLCKVVSPQTGTSKVLPRFGLGQHFYLFDRSGTMMKSHGTKGVCLSLCAKSEEKAHKLKTGQVNLVPAMLRVCVKSL